ncbi:MAG: branched-chain amino acid transaminase [Dehalococcoidia bacterium]|nr:branched-chain amino acid transaminase [Dehalococcoidia bacterium]
MPTPTAYFKKQFVPLAEAKIGVMTHAFNYGTACFEGIRGNWNQDEGQIYVFRTREHFQRLKASCRILRIDLPYTVDELCDITLSSEMLGVRLHDLEDDFLLFVTPFGPYLDVEKGIRCCVSTWRRVDDNTIPARAKINGLYVNSALAKTEAHDNGMDEAIILNQDGHVSEGSGENIFLVMNGKLVTPPVSDNILVGITRDTVMTLAMNEFGIETVERSIDRSELYICDECFMTGTAAHVSPVLEVDHRPVGDGKAGAITSRLQKLYFDVLKGKNPKYREWCTPAYSKLVKA